MKKGTRRIPLTQGKFAIVDAIDYDWLMQWKWRVLKRKDGRMFYAMRNGKRPNQQVFYMHRKIMERAFPNNLLPHCDHANRNGLNNTRRNLRPCTRSQNLMNARKRIGTSSRYKGVHWNKNVKRWIVKIKVDDRRLSLGQFVKERDAGKSYAKAAIRYFGAFAFAEHL